MQRNSSIIEAVILLAIVTALTPKPVLAQKVDAIRRSLFGLTLNGCSVQLLDEVERAFNRPVREEWLDDPVGMSGASKVSSDGAPTVLINRVHGKTLDVIVHELYHLKMKAAGYPALLWLFPKEMDVPPNHAAFSQLAKQVHDPIEHYMFYGTIRACGINPGRAFERRTDQMLKDGSMQKAYLTMDRDAVALYWFKIRLEVEEGPLTHKVHEALRVAGKQDGMVFGDTLTQIVLNGRPISAEGEVQTTIAVLNRFYGGRFSFREHGWRTKLLGNFTQQQAGIEVVPIR